VSRAAEALAWAPQADAQPESVVHLPLLSAGRKRVISAPQNGYALRFSALGAG